MDGRHEHHKRADLISAMFALLTSRLEDAATVAGESQGRRSPRELRANSERIEGMMAEATTLCAALTTLLHDGVPGDHG